MLRLIPVMAEPIAITTVTPMATPSTVSDARTLLERTESSAIPTPSAMRLSTVIGRAGVTRPSRDDGIESRGTAGGVDPGHDAHAYAERHSSNT